VNDIRIGRQLRAAVLALLYLCGYLGSALHEASVRHAVCEHGEFVDLPAAHVPVPAFEPGQALLNLGPTLVASHLGSSESEHVHDHCSNVVPISGPAPSHFATGASLPLIEIVAGPRSDSLAHAHSFPIYLLAPNHSPPAA
jgi:hypothetical protein